MRSMVTGESMMISRKTKGGIKHRWTAPLIMVGNSVPDYTNTGGNLTHRFVTFRFNNPVLNPREGLEQLITADELPNIVCKLLRAYKRLRERVAEAVGFWSCVPGRVVEWQQQLAVMTNKLHEFLDMDDDERRVAIRRVAIRRVPGRVTLVKRFKEAFSECMRQSLKELDAVVLAQFGYRLSE